MFIKNKFLFRCIVIFFVLLIFPFPLSIIPGLEFVSGNLTELYHIIIPWMAENILQLETPITVFTNGSGDTTYDYVLVLFFLILAIIGAVLWTILDKKKLNLEKVSYWFTVMLRYYLGYSMMSYGWQKVIPLQFQEPTFYRLLEPIGAMSPMGLAWTFIGFSAGYTIFSGLAEVIGGILLFHKRTQYLGGLILVVVMANVMALNYFYDVPVKLYSTELWLMAIIIAAPKLKTFLNAIMNLKATNPKPFFQAFTKQKHRNIAAVVKWAFAIFIVVSPLYGAIGATEQYGRSAPKPPLYGLYEVTEFKANGEVLPPVLNDTVRWRYIAIEYPGSTQFYKTNMKRFGYRSEVDSLAQEITWTNFRDSTKVYTFKYTRTDSTMRFQGIHKNDTIDCMTRIKYKKDFRLMNRGYNWIQEYPFNR